MRCLGRLPAQHNPAIPPLRALLTAQPEKPPESINWWAPVGSWPMLANDWLGDCVPAGALHMIQQRLAYRGVSWAATDDDVVQLYQHWGGYDPQNPGTDNGCIMATAMAQWAATGVPIPDGLDRPDAIMSLDHMSTEWIDYALWRFGAVLIGIYCPVEWLTDTAYLFDLPNGLGQVAGGHCMLVVGREPTALGVEYDVVTWGFRGRMVDRAARLVIEEAYAVLDRDWMDANNRDPAGVDWAMAQYAMQQLRGIS